ncbi:hypothetical protein HMPREF9702_04527 [Delftia acidovorans CCUG 15835]|nr:hypothetical protein HMPREF9702_04527 [Delftia acidovorans CCUG 15835]
MKQRPRIYYTEAQKAMMWDRWSKGDTLHQIGKLFDRPHTSILTLPRFHVQQEVGNFKGTENRDERRQAAQEAVHRGIQG